MSLNYDEKVKNLLSEGVYEVLLNAVDEGKIDQKKAESIAEQLHKSVVGDFRRQVSSDSFDRTDFREILSGWYQYSAFDFKHEEAVKCLIRTLKHPNLGEDLLSSKLYQNNSNFFFQLALATRLPKKSKTWRSKRTKRWFSSLGRPGWARAPSATPSPALKSSRLALEQNPARKRSVSKRDSSGEMKPSPSLSSTLSGSMMA